MDIRSGYSWQAFEDDYLIENFLIKTDNEISEILKRTNYSVLQRRYKLGLLRQKSSRKLPHNVMLLAHRERDKMLSVFNMVTKMKELIKICETSENTYQKEMAIQQLKKLSGL